jgi:hypothetical protein
MKSKLLALVIVATSLSAVAISNERVQVEPSQFLTPCEYVALNVAMAIQLGQLTNTSPTSTGAFTKLRQNRNTQGIDTQYLLGVGQSLYSGKDSIDKVRQRVTTECIAKFVE